MDLQLTNKVFIVTGATGGIGEAIARELAAEGAIPVIVGRNQTSGEQIKAELEADGLSCHFIPFDLGNGISCESIISETIEKYGQIDGVINNAGTNDGVGLEKGNPGAFRKSILCNLTHYYDMVHFSLPYLKKTKGSIVNISSKTAVTGQGGTSAYAAAKGAQLALTREWAVELAPFGIRVNAIIPAEVMTPQYVSWIQTLPEPDETLKKIVSNIPLGQRMTLSEEIASMAVFVLSEKSSHTTGQWLYVDGGYVHFDRAMLQA